MPENVFIQFWKYNDWANNLLFDVFDKYDEKMPASCLRLLSHIVDCQSVWLTRLKNEKQTVGVWEMQDLKGCRKLHALTAMGLKKTIELHSDDLFAEIAYVNSAGNSFRNTVYDILLHLFNHGTYHRGQIAMEMRKNGLEPVSTDYIVFVR
jgi:uncharacterized damage-inducible protein DinB